jgi:hypothetical protein
MSTVSERTTTLNAQANKKGFASHNEYLKYFAKAKGFDSYNEYQVHKVREKGFESIAAYRKRDDPVKPKMSLDSIRAKYGIKEPA